MSRKPRGVLIAGNWKMNYGLKETETFLLEFFHAADKQLSGKAGDAFTSGKLRAQIYPPAICLETALTCCTQSANVPIGVGAQNAYGVKTGAFTGELSGPMLEELGVRSVLVGHSERRQHFGETDDSARKRAEGLLAQGFEVIYCIGETRAEREAGKTQFVLSNQLAAILVPGVPLNGRLVLAYEPVWAIGTGLVATPEQAEEAHAFIRAELGKRSRSAAETTPILYGGSVTPENVKQLLACPNVDGALVGGASLKPEGFLKLIVAGFEALAG
jgi:triosephosphate isomerase